MVEEGKRKEDREGGVDVTVREFGVLGSLAEE